jgi:hypothetical protein
MVRSIVLLVAAVHVAAAAEWDADLHLHPQSTVEKFDVRTTPGRTGSMHRTGHWSTHAAACRRCCEPHHPCTLRAAHPGLKPLLLLAGQVPGRFARRLLLPQGLDSRRRDQVEVPFHGRRALNFLSNLPTSFSRA